jgi:hypothetical protein
MEFEIDRALSPCTMDFDFFLAEGIRTLVPRAKSREAYILTVYSSGKSRSILTTEQMTSGWAKNSRAERELIELLDRLDGVNLPRDEADVR